MSNWEAIRDMGLGWSIVALLAAVYAWLWRRS